MSPRTAGRVLVNGVRHVYSTMFLHVPNGARHLEVGTSHGWTVRVYEIGLTDWPDGRRTVSIEGLHIKKNGDPGSHRRGGSWLAPDLLPALLAEVVEDARPGWWTGQEAGR